MAVEGGFHKFRNVKFNESPTYLPFMEFDEVCAKSDEHDESVSDEAIEKFLVEGKELLYCWCLQLLQLKRDMFN